MKRHSKRPWDTTQQGVCKRLYYDQCKSSNTRGHNKPAYTKEELVAWVTTQPNFNTIYEAWKASDYESDLRPSCDRLDNSKGYSFDNIELVTWAENKQRANDGVVAGSLGDFHKPAYQYDLDGKFIAKFISQAEAERVTGTNQQNISACCRGLLNHTNRSQWFFELQDSVAKVEANNDYIREIYCYTLKGELVDVYPELSYVEEDGFSQEKVRSVITGEYKSHNRHFWSFDYLTPNQINVDTTYQPTQVQQLTKDGTLVASFDSMSQAEQLTGIRSGNISKCCNGKAKSAGGYVWKRK